MHDWELGILIPVVAVPFFVFGYLFICWSAANLSGWRLLAGLYPESDQYVATVYRFQRVSLGWGNYPVTVHLSEDRVTLKQSIPSLLFHPAITIQFDDIQAAERGGTFPLHWLDVSVDGIRFRLRGSIRNDPIWDRLEDDEQ